ncbi:transposase [Salinarchaeum sp. IM2453]|uniref:transposase n=1 Tax=Salinarchaeum sp. IM2453 TaxID=2862870 RepID=UPI00210322E2
MSRRTNGHSSVSTFGRHVSLSLPNPQGTSRSCPRCGSTGHTCKSPDHQQEHWCGGHFRCDNARCGFESDRDYTGALNVAQSSSSVPVLYGVLLKTTEN